LRMIFWLISRSEKLPIQAGPPTMMSVYIVQV
jgi:hypothetical protein